jgi:hypothetical protein
MKCAAPSKSTLRISAKQNSPPAERAPNRRGAITDSHDAQNVIGVTSLCYATMIDELPIEILNQSAVFHLKLRGSRAPAAFDSRQG